jgi:iron complex outermembrane recepter protein
MRLGKTKISKLAAAIASATLMQTALPVLAQGGAVLDEIVVTAQKREENLSDVPLSVVVIDSDKLATAHVTRIADLTEFVPNLTMTETGISTQMYVRGIGSGNNQAFEQSVGQYVDGVYYGRQQLIRAPFFDLDRVEVLRGPQGTLFGKNTIAGALNLTTAKPSDEFEVELKALYEFESAQQEINAVVSGPLSDTFRARLAYRGYEEDGYVKNTFLNTDEPQRDEDAIRLILDWDISPEFNATLKVEHDTFDTVGRQIEIVRDDPNLIPAGAPTPIAGLNYAQITNLVFGQPAMDTTFNYQRQVNAPEFSDTTLDNVTLNLTYDLGGNTLTSVSSLMEYDFIERCDCDYIPTSIIEVGLQEDYEQFSQEIRLSSPTGQNFEWTVGAYYQNTEMKSKEDIDIPLNSLFGILAATSSNPSTQALAALPGTSARRLNAQDSDSWALFAQGTYDFDNDFRLTVGARYTEEDKDATRVMDVLDTATQTVTTNPVAPLVWYGAFQLYNEQALFVPDGMGGFMPSPGHNLAGSRGESSFTPMINLQWDVSDNTMLYAGASKGFKAGGFDARANNPFSFEFEEEETSSFELGAKSLLLNGALELNAALFFTDYDALQIAQFDGRLGFNVGNANNTEVSGLEIDGRWAVTNNLVVSYAYAYLDFEFTDFSNGNCYNRQPANGDVINGVPLCDYTGFSGKYTPENNVSLSLDYTRQLSSEMELFSNLNFNFVGSQNVHDNLDPNFNIDSYTKINLRLGVQTDSWSLALIGKNLTDEKVLTYAGNAPLSDSNFLTNTFYGFVDRPRQIALEAGFRF